MNETKPTSILQSTDWDKEWQGFCAPVDRNADMSFWDRRSSSFTAKDSPKAYVRAFMELAGIARGESILDMGCGAGHLSIPFAQMGCKVIAADFSQGMLDKLDEAARHFGVTGIDRVQLAWEDNWEEAGIGPKSVDAVISSRSIASFSLSEHVRKMNSTARRLCCATVNCGTSPRIDARILSVCGIAPRAPRTNQYLMNILINKGHFPTCQYLSSTRESSYENAFDAHEDYRRMLAMAIGDEDPAFEEHAAKLEAWLDSMLVENKSPHEECPGKIMIKEPRISTWAFIAWNPEPGQILT